MQRIRREFAAANDRTIVCALQEEGISGYKVRAADRDKIQLIKDYAQRELFDMLCMDFESFLRYNRPKGTVGTPRESLALIEAGKIDTTPLITHRYKLVDIEAAYHLFENKLDGVIKTAILP